MNIPSNPPPRSVPDPTELPNPGITTLPRLWLDLPPETQQQIPGSFALLLLRMTNHRADKGESALLRASNSSDERVTTEHRGKLAYIYVRQFSVNQMRHHQESTELQHRLVDRAVALDWPQERVHVIDEDLDKSGAGTVERVGFKKLIAEIGLGSAGLVISLDASRLARNNRDWHQLLDLCRCSASS